VTPIFPYRKALFADARPVLTPKSPIFRWIRGNASQRRGLVAARRMISAVVAPVAADHVKSECRHNREAEFWASDGQARRMERMEQRELT